MTSELPYTGEPHRPVTGPVFADGQPPAFPTWPEEADSTAVLAKIADAPSAADFWSTPVSPDGDTVALPPPTGRTALGPPRDESATAVIPVVRDDASATGIIPVFQDAAAPQVAPAEPIFEPPGRRPSYRRGRTVALHRTKNVATRADAAGFIRFKLRERRRRIADRVRAIHGRHGGRRLKVLSTLLAFAIVAAGVGVFWLVSPGKPPATTTNSPRGWTAATGFGNPFAGTPADSFPKGAAGIVPPAARAVAGWPSQRVSAALAQVTQALIETRLSPTLVRDHDPSKFLALIAPRQQDALQRELDGGKAAAYVSLLANGVTLLDDPRAKGTFTYHASINDQGINVLEITSNFVWAYAVAPTAHRPGPSLIVVHDRIVWQVADPAFVPESDAGLWLGDAESYAANVDCAEFAGGYLAPTPSGAGTSPVTSIADLYIPGAELTEPTCE